MRLSAFVIAFVLSCVPAMAAPSTPTQKPVFHSMEATANWVSNYPRHHDIKHAPVAIRALSAHGAFRDADGAGTYVGFIAGLIGSNPDKADALIEGMLPVA